MAKTAFIGLGVMGAPMAGHLARAGHDVRVYNRSEEKARDWAQKHKGRTYSSVANAADGADIVFSCVGNDRDLREVFEAAATTMRKGAIFVDHTTASADDRARAGGEGRSAGLRLSRCAGVRRASGRGSGQAHGDGGRRAQRVR